MWLHPQIHIHRADPSIWTQYPPHWLDRRHSSSHHSPSTPAPTFVAMKCLYLPLVLVSLWSRYFRYVVVWVNRKSYLVDKFPSICPPIHTSPRNFTSPAAAPCPTLSDWRDVIPSDKCVWWMVGMYTHFGNPKREKTSESNLRMAWWGKKWRNLRRRRRNSNPINTDTRRPNEWGRDVLWFLGEGGDGWWWCWLVGR